MTRFANYSTIVSWKEQTPDTLQERRHCNPLKSLKPPPSTLQNETQTQITAHYK